MFRSNQISFTHWDSEYINILSVGARWTFNFSDVFLPAAPASVHVEGNDGRPTAVCHSQLSVHRHGHWTTTCCRVTSMPPPDTSLQMRSFDTTGSSRPGSFETTVRIMFVACNQWSTFISGYHLQEQQRHVKGLVQKPYNCSYLVFA